jgi:hypothetical protein
MARFSSDHRPALSRQRAANQKAVAKHLAGAASTKIKARKSKEPAPVTERRHSRDGKPKVTLTSIPGRRTALTAERKNLVLGPRGTSITLSVQVGVNWQTDTVMVNPDGQRVWVKDIFTSKGQPIGSGPCCFESEPCKWHKSLSRLYDGGTPILPKRVH